MTKSRTRHVDPQPALAIARRLVAGGASARLTRNHEPSAWARTEMARIQNASINGRLDTCRHLHVDDVGIVALWRPDLAVCLSCILELAVLDETENYRCDRCGNVSDSVAGLAFTFHQVVILTGLCASCAAREEGR